MGVTVATVSLRNSHDYEAPLCIRQARIDDDIMELFVPASLADDLGLPFVQMRRINLNRVSGGRGKPWPSEARSVGPVALTAWGRTTWCEALVHGDEIVLGWQPRLALLHDDYPSVFSHDTDMDPGLRRDDEQV